MKRAKKTRPVPAVAPACMNRPDAGECVKLSEEIDEMLLELLVDLHSCEAQPDAYRMVAKIAGHNLVVRGHIQSALEREAS